jgi:hypothetical protein
MNIEQATRIVEFLERYNKHFAETIDFLNRKQQKVLADDLLWLHDSLSDEQRLSMAGLSLETKRIEMLEAMGFEEHTSAQLLEICPEECKGRLKMECENIEKAIDAIKLLNADILEAIEKKISAAEAYLREKGVSNPQVYDGAGTKIRTGDLDDNIIGSM